MNVKDIKQDIKDEKKVYLLEPKAGRTRQIFGIKGRTKEISVKVQTLNGELIWKPITKSDVITVEK